MGLFKMKLISKFTVYPTLAGLALLIVGNILKAIKIPFVGAILSPLGGLIAKIGTWCLIAVGIYVLIYFLLKILKGFKRKGKGMGGLFSFFKKDKSGTASTGNSGAGASGSPGPNIIINNTNTAPSEGSLKNMDTF